MQLAWSRIWTRVTVSISYHNSHYTIFPINYFMLGYYDLLSWPTIEMNTIYESWIKKAQLEKIMRYEIG